MPKFTSIMHNSGDNDNVTVAVVSGPDATAEIANMICIGAALGVENEDDDMDDIYIHHVATFAGGPRETLAVGSGCGFGGNVLEIKAGSRKAGKYLALAERFVEEQGDPVE